MINFDYLNGFVIDLSTKDYCNDILADILCGDDVEYKKVIKYSLQRKRDYILTYFTNTYDYIFCRGLYVYQICESELQEQTYNNYVVFLLGADDTPIARKIRELSEKYGMDAVFEVCEGIASKFEEFDKNHTDMSTYESLNLFLSAHEVEVANYINECCGVE